MVIFGHADREWLPQRRVHEKFQEQTWCPLAP